MICQTNPKKTNLSYKCFFIANIVKFFLKTLFDKLLQRTYRVELEIDCRLVSNKKKILIDIL